jgi:hypothetical protein
MVTAAIATAMMMLIFVMCGYKASLISQYHGWTANVTVSAG